jgi:hypothetical protein
MGRKKKTELVFCYYCDKICKDEATLVQHQKAVHFKCPGNAPCAWVDISWSRAGLGALTRSLFIEVEAGAALL